MESSDSDCWKPTTAAKAASADGKAKKWPSPARSISAPPWRVAKAQRRGWCGGGEGEEGAVAGRVDPGAAGAGDEAPGAVARGVGGVLLVRPRAARLPQPPLGGGRALDVGEDEGDDPAGMLAARHAGGLTGAA